MTDSPSLQPKAAIPLTPGRAAPPAPEPALTAGTLSFPSRPRSAGAAAAKRILLAVGLLALASAIVYLGRHGYRDAAHPGRPLSVLGSVYYATVTLSTIGYGDIVPVTSAARLVNTIVITPMRVVFLILLVGTTLQVLTERTRTNWRIARWRSKMNSQIIVIGYGTKGRSAVRTLTESGTAQKSIVTVDLRPDAAGDATAAGLVAVAGDGTRQEVLRCAEIGSARQVVIAVGRDETAALIALTVRQLNPGVAIVAAVREEENQDLLRQAGADQVVITSGAAGRLLAISAVRPAAGQVLTDLLDRGRGLDLAERPVAPAEVGTPAQEAQGTVIALLRGDQVLAADHPAARRLARSDRLILVSSHQPPIIGHDTTQPEEYAHASHHL
jgi:voltage-gated potassium channel